MSSLLLIAPLSDVNAGRGNFGAPALGVWRLAFWLRRHGHEVDVWDCNVQPGQPGDHHDLSRYAWIGFSVLNDTLPLTLGLINRLAKLCLNAKLVAGNAEATLNYQDLLDKSPLDGVILAEGEEALNSLMLGVPPHEVPGVIWRTRSRPNTLERYGRWWGNVDWSAIPYEVYWRQTEALYDLDAMTPDDRLEKLYEIHTVRVVTMDTCPLGCTFCSVANIHRFATGSSGTKWVSLDEAALEDMLLKVKHQVPGVMTIYDCSDEVFLGNGRADEYVSVLEGVKNEMDAGLPRGMRYLIQCRSVDLSRELVQRLAVVGVRHLTVGVETPIERLQREIRKPQRRAQIEGFIEWATEAGVRPYILIILFQPDMTLDELRETIRILRDWQRRGATASIEPFMMAYRGAPLWDDDRYDWEHRTYPVPGTRHKLKWASLIKPRDPKVREVLVEFRNRIDSYVNRHLSEQGHRHSFKGETGRVVIECVADILDELDNGGVRVWRDEVVGGVMTGARFNTAHVGMDAR